MTPLLSSVIGASVVGLLVCVWWFNVVRARPRRVLRAVALTVLAAAALRYAFVEPVEAKGTVHETLAIVFCYASMVLGMVAQYGYTQARTQNFRFDPAVFFMPIFVSPIVFIPLLTVVADVNTTGALAQPKLMVYLIAFQNGFFWRGFFSPHSSFSNTSSIVSPNASAMRNASGSEGSNLPFSTELIELRETRTRSANSA